MCSDEVQKETSTDRCMSKVPLHCKELGLGAVFSIGKLHSTSLHVFQLDLVCSIPVYISDYPRVFEVNQGVVDKETTSGGGVEDIKVSVLNSSSVEIGGGEGSSVKGGGVFLITLVTDADEMSVFVDSPVTDISGSFRLPFLVKEDNGIEVRLSAVVPYPSFTWVVRVLKVASEWGGKANRLRGGSGSGNSRLVLSKADRFVAIDTVVLHVRLSEVKNARNEE